MSKLASLAPLALAVALVIPACGGDDPPAAPADGPPAPSSDAAVDGPTTTADSGPSTDGNAACDPFACQGGAHCMGNACVCPQPFVTNPLDYSGFVNALVPFQGNLLAARQFSDPHESYDNAIIAGLSMASTQQGTEYTLGGGANPLTPPFLGVGYNVVIAQPPDADGGFYATSGTITFTRICPPPVPGQPGGGIEAVANNVHFQGIKGSLTAPSIDPQGCGFDVAHLEISIGTCPPET